MDTPYHVPKSALVKFYPKVIEADEAGLQRPLLPGVIGVTIVFDLGEPVGARMALVHFGEFPARGSRSA